MKHSFPAARHPIQYNERGELFLLKDSIRSFIPLAEYATPFMVVHLAIIREKLARFRQAFPQLHPYFSLHAHADRDVLNTLAEEKMRFLVHATSDIKVLQSLNIPPESMIYGNVIHTKESITQAMQYGIRRFTIDSLEEMQKILDLNTSVELFLQLDMSGIRGQPQRFPLAGHPGICSSDAPLFIEAAKHQGKQLCGLSFHVGSQCFNPQCWMEGIRRAHATAQIMQHVGLPLRYLNIGGGFPIELSKSIPAIEDTARVIQQALKTLSPGVEIIAVPSRFLIGDSGYLISRILQKTQRAHKNWLHIDAGAIEALFESQQGIQYPILTDLTGQTCRWQIAGPGLSYADLCFKDYVLPTQLQTDDMLYIKNAVAYQNRYHSSRYPASPYTVTIDSATQPHH